MKQILLLVAFLYIDDAYGQFYNETVTLPNDAMEKIQDCKNDGISQGVPAEDLWQVELACLVSYYNQLPSNNLTADDWKPFKEAEESGFGFRPPPTGFRKRRELRTLTDEEWNKTVNVFVQMYKTGTLRAFGRLHSHVGKTAHRGAAFLMWHRVFITHFEEEMRKIDPTVSLPYWDYSADFYIAKPTESVVWSECFFGADDDVISGHFENFYGAHYSYVTRNANSDCFGKLISLEDIDKLLQFCSLTNITTGRSTEEEYLKQKHSVELHHDSVHDWVGGDMGRVLNSAFDPVFFMHHAYIDYIFEEFLGHQNKSCPNVNRESDYRPLNDLCQKCNDSDPSRGHGPNEAMYGYPKIRNIDGLWLNWTTLYYNYEPRPSCPDNCNGKYLYCNTTFDPKRYPDGICLTKLKEDGCKDNSVRIRRSARDAGFLTPTLSCMASGHKFEVLEGDGRNRRMSVHDSWEKLQQYFASFLDTGNSDEADESDSAPSVISIIFGILLGIETVVILLLTIYLFRKHTQSSKGRPYDTGSGDNL